MYTSSLLSRSFSKDSLLFLIPLLLSALMLAGMPMHAYATNSYHSVNLTVYATDNVSSESVAVQYMSGGGNFPSICFTIKPNQPNQTTTLTAISTTNPLTSSVMGITQIVLSPHSTNCGGSNGQLTYTAWIRSEPLTFTNNSCNFSFQNDTFSGCVASPIQTGTPIQSGS